MFKALAKPGLFYSSHEQSISYGCFEEKRYSKDSTTKAHSKP
jgi:hypothetical protein